MGIDKDAFSQEIFSILSHVFAWQPGTHGVHDEHCSCGPWSRATSQIMTALDEAEKKAAQEKS